MGITTASLIRQTVHIERVAVQDDGAEPLDVYLIELISVTVAATQALARTLRNRAGNYLLVLTDDYERIDFILLQRFLPSSSASPMTMRQVSVRPRILTVNRRNPSQVQLRVLRRFTYTEADSDAQYDKLLSAYTVAEWSEPLFNNRALFSDYYLNERLPELNDWKERPEDPYHSLRELLSEARRPVDTGGNGATVQSLVRPALEALGFEVAARPGAEGPDYVLCAPSKPEKPVAVCLAYAWNRYLDGRDETRDMLTPDENPGARVVTVLESGEAPWAIVTNGKLWRLYSARTHSRSTNYYEIDLEETLAMADPNRAFRYFWLFFRLKAFVTREALQDGPTSESSFLDRVLDESESYAKGLGERLKERVFEEVFPHFAEGFIEHLKGQVGMAGPQQASMLPIVEQLQLKQEPDEEFRRQVFQGTLTLLYRLLFLLYAESRGLLPVKEERGYWEQSLTRLKEQIAEKAGAVLDETRARLQKSYGASVADTELYDQLLHLFSVIGKGSRELNVPLYNGGLFITSPDSVDYDQESEAARFLALHKIPDRYLARGLDLLARDQDDKRQDLVFIDYKSLGVRQLGSIYEGLLEFKVRIAGEKMAVVKGKKTEEVVPYKEAIKSKRKVLTVGRGRNARERVVKRGDVYLENDRRERKASGSYYTPNHIVKYIVENTVGPVLSEKFEKLRPKFRDAQQAYGRALARVTGFKKRGMNPDDPAKVANTYEGLVDNLFDLKVLDPAMGSGHFLVEAVDFICDRILGEREGFLRAFPWNPVTKYLQNTREAIIDEMERQGVTVDTSRLTDINLLKRHVLKRCVYGVDLNPMAVELAKVSLWLDCFTIGAPLSFLDHHLKCGNSLIGATVREVEAELAKQKKGHVSDLFGSEFQGVLAGTSAMLDIAKSPDATVKQAEFSRSRFAYLESNQAPFKTALDIWLSQYFGNKLAKEVLTLTSTDLVEDIRSGGKKLSPDYREAISRAGVIGDKKRFFHWDLEFPEAFVDLGRGRWKPRDEQGFDAVVGNPPYDVLASKELGYDVTPLIGYCKTMTAYDPAVLGKLNLYKLFICQALSLAQRRRFLSFIVPMSLLGDAQSAGLRQHLLENASLRFVESFPQKDDSRRRVFPEAKLSTCVFVCENAGATDTFQVRTHPAGHIEVESDSHWVTQSEVSLFSKANKTIASCPRRDWEIVSRVLSNKAMVRLGQRVKFFQGEINETNEKARGTINTEGQGQRVIRGANVTLFAVRDASQGHDLYVMVDRFLKCKSPRSKAHHYRMRRVAYQGNAAQNNFRRIIAAPVSSGEFCAYTVNYCTESSSNLSLDFLIALLNSNILEWWFRLGSSNAHANEYQMNDLPIPCSTSHPSVIDWRSSFQHSEWNALGYTLRRACTAPGYLPNSVAEAIEAMSKRIQDIEARRKLAGRADRSSLDTESQPIQEVINEVLYRYYGLSEDDAQYIEERLGNML